MRQAQQCHLLASLSAWPSHRMSLKVYKVYGQRGRSAVPTFLCCESAVNAMLPGCQYSTTRWQAELMRQAELDADGSAGASTPKA